MVGYGFMGRTHSNAFAQVNHFFDVPYQPVLKTICARNVERARGFAEKWGYQSVETDWRNVVESPEIDLVDIASPNDTHAEIAVAAAEAGKGLTVEFLSLQCVFSLGSGHSICSRRGDGRQVRNMLNCLPADLAHALRIHTERAQLQQAA